LSETPLLALYIHVPFCRQRCVYCHFDVKIFHPRTDPAPFLARYVDTLLTELTCEAGRYANRKLTSVFYGGGTPSRLGLAGLDRIQTAVAQNFALADDCEISCEVNPEDASPAFLSGLRDLGVNRLSFGVQTFDERGLRALNRAHDRADALRALEAATGFAKGRSIDLMLGLPFQDRRALSADLDLVERFVLEHVSVYMLERDLPTPLDKLARDWPAPDDDAQATLYEIVRNRLRNRGYAHYEISNFAKPGFACRHNLTYWTCGDYLGLGPAAHGRVGHEYRRAHAAFSNWAAAIEQNGTGVAQHETWSAERLRQERLVQGLRLSRGVPLAWISDSELKRSTALDAHGLTWTRNGRLGLTDRGQLLANEVFEIFVEPNEPDKGNCMDNHCQKPK